MANTFAPFGFQQYSGTGSAPTYEQVSLLISSGYSTAIYNGDAVIALNTGYINVAGNQNTTVLAGVFIGCKYTSVSQKRTVWSNYWPGSDANGDVTAYVVNDPNAQFKAQVNGGPITAAKVGQLVTNDTTQAGNSSTGISGMAIYATPTNTSTYPFRLTAVITNPPGANGTDITSANNLVVVGFNNVITRNNSAVTGI
jgi:hypothetical protein